MSKYVMLTTLTDQGLQTLRSHPERLRAVNKDAEELGVKVLHQWACLGPFDFVNVIDGSSGDDTVFGLGGDDHLIGGPGTDTADGGDGTDVCETFENLTSC